MKKSVYISTTAAISPNGVRGEDGILHAVLPNYKDIITNANLRRRMSHIVKMGVACGLLCLQQNGNKPIDAIITATGLGCLADTEKFLNSIIENDERLLNPTAFTQSTFNVIGAQIALLTNNHAYNNTFVHRGLSFEGALIDAMMRICEGDKNVLLGAVDEASSTTHTIMQRLGLLRNLEMGEGAQFFILSNEGDVEVKGVKNFTGRQTVNECKERIKTFLYEHNISFADVGCLITGENGNATHDRAYTEVVSMFPATEKKTFKDVCGEYPTASSYGLYMGVEHLKNSTLTKQNVLLCNSYNSVNHSLIMLAK